MNKFFAKGLEFLHVVFNVIGKRGPVFLLLVFTSLYKDAARKTKWFFAYSISRKRSKVQRKNYGTLLNIPKQNCMRNLQHFRQSSLLRKIHNALFQLSPSDKRSQGLCYDKQSRSFVIIAKPSLCYKSKSRLSLL